MKDFQVQSLNIILSFPDPLLLVGITKYVSISLEFSYAELLKFLRSAVRTQRKY